MQKALVNRIRPVVNVEFDRIKLGLLYGSRKQGRDTDVFLVYDNQPQRKNLVYEDLDLFQASQQDVVFRLSNWDPEYTEPLLTGERLIGDAVFYEELKKYLTDRRPTPANLDYLGKRSLETLHQAAIMFQNGRYELLVDKIRKNEQAENISPALLGKGNEKITSQTVLGALSVLGYAYSYLAFRKRYEKFKDALTLAALLKSPQNDVERRMKNLLGYVKKRKPDGSKIVLSEVDDYFESAREVLLREI